MLRTNSNKLIKFTRAFSCPSAGSCPSTAKNAAPTLSGVTQENVDRWKRSDTFEETRKPIAYATTIPPEAYHDHSYHVAEQQELFGKEWFCVGHTAEIPKRGDTKMVDVGSQSFILTRDKKMNVNAFYNVCRHRGAKLVENEDAVNRKRLNCPYHWWSYRLTGELVSTPFFESDNFSKGNYGLFKLRVETWNGLIFINQDKDALPFRTKFEQLTKQFENYPMNEMNIIGQKTYEVDIDWKLLAENFMEWYHVAPVHPELAKFSTPEKHLMWDGHGQYVGFMTHPVTNSGGPADTDLFHPTPYSNKFDQETAFFYHLFPNVSVTIYPHSVYTLVMLPMGPGKTKETLYLLQHPESRLEEDSDEVFRAKADALLAFVTKVNEEDIWVCKKVAKGLRNSQYRGGRFQPDMEQTCYRFQNMVADSMIDRKDLIYPPQMIDYYRAFPHLHPDYKTPEAPLEETESMADTLLNIDGMTSHDVVETEQQQQGEEVQYSVVEVNLEANTVEVVVAELDLEKQKIEISAKIHENLATIVEYDPATESLFNPVLEVTEEGIKVEISTEAVPEDRSSEGTSN